MSGNDPLTSQSARILLVDDDPIMCELAKVKLEEAAYDVLVASDGAQAVPLLDAHDIDLVISDIDMPGMDGFELTRHIRMSAHLQEIPVIVITASDRADVAAQAFEAGATSFLDKPINWTLFSHAVKFVLRANADRKALREARDQAEAGGRFKDSLMSVMSHELRTPLNAIIGFGQLLREQFDTQQDIQNRDYADYIIDGGRRLLNSVSDMLLAAAARSGPITLNEVDATLGELFQLACSYTQKETELAAAQIKLQLHNPDLELRCDRLLMARSISKLIDNAIKFSPKGVRILLASVELENGECAIIIRDDGPGIPQDKLTMISTPFTQSDMSLKRSKEGLGLGLPLVKAVTTSHGGRFLLDTTEGKGAQAIILMPENRIVRHQMIDVSEDEEPKILARAS